MFNQMQDKLMNRFFRSVDNVVWDLFTGKIGVQTEEGIITLEGTGEDAQIVVNIMDQFGTPIPAYAQSTPLQAIQAGDLVYAKGKPKGWVVSVSERPATDDKPAVKKFTLMTTSGMTTSWTPPKVSMLGFESGVMVLKSLIQLLPSGQTGLSSLQNNILPMMMIAGDNVDMEKILPFMLFTQTQGNGGDSNNLMQTMFMMSMMKGGSNPMENMFKGKGSKGHFDN